MQKDSLMDDIQGGTQDLVRNQLKVLLLHLAAKSDNPGIELQVLLREVIEELHSEVKSTLKKNRHLNLVNQRP